MVISTLSFPAAPGPDDWQRFQAGDADSWSAGRGCERWSPLLLLLNASHRSLPSSSPIGLRHDQSCLRGWGVDDRTWSVGGGPYDDAAGAGYGPEPGYGAQAGYPGARFGAPPPPGQQTPPGQTRPEWLEWDPAESAQQRRGAAGPRGGYGAERPGTARPAGPAGGPTGAFAQARHREKQSPTRSSLPFSKTCVLRRLVCYCAWRMNKRVLSSLPAGFPGGFEREGSRRRRRPADEHRRVGGPDGQPRRLVEGGGRGRANQQLGGRPVEGMLRAGGGRHDAAAAQPAASHGNHAAAARRAAARRPGRPPRCCWLLLLRRPAAFRQQVAPRGDSPPFATQTQQKTNRRCRADQQQARRPTRCCCCWYCCDAAAWRALRQRRLLPPAPAAASPPPPTLTSCSFPPVSAHGSCRYEKGSARPPRPVRSTIASVLSSRSALLVSGELPNTRRISLSSMIWSPMYSRIMRANRWIRVSFFPPEAPPRPLPPGARRPLRRERAKEEGVSTSALRRLGMRRGVKHQSHGRKNHACCGLP